MQRAPRVYQRRGLPAWKKAAYYAHDVVLPEGAAACCATMYHRVARRSASVG